MEDIFSGNFHDTRTPGEIAVDIFESQYACRFGKILGLSTTLRTIVVNVSDHHLAFLIQCERAMGRTVVYLCREDMALSDTVYSQIAKYTELKTLVNDITPRPFRDHTGVILVCPKSNTLDHIANVLTTRYTVIVPYTDSIATTKVRNNIARLLSCADRVIYNSIIPDFKCEVCNVSETCALDELRIPYRSYDIYTRVKVYLIGNKNEWVKRSDAIRAVMKTGEKYESMCFRIYDIPYTEYHVMDTNVVYVRKIKHTIYLKIHI